MRGNFNMAKRATLNPLTDTPTSLTDLTKRFMLDYIKAQGTAEDRKWFKKIVAEQKEEKPNKVGKEDGETCYGIKSIKELHNAFAKRFFPNLLKVDKWFDEVENL